MQILRDKELARILSNCHNLPQVVDGKEVVVMYNTRDLLLKIGEMALFLADSFFKEAVRLIDEENPNPPSFEPGNNRHVCSKVCEPPLVAAILAVYEVNVIVREISENLFFASDKKLTLQDQLQNLNGLYSLPSLVRGRAELYGLLTPTQISYCRDVNQLNQFVDREFDRLIIMNGYSSAASAPEESGSRDTLPARVVALWPRSADFPPQGYSWLTA